MLRPVANVVPPGPIEFVLGFHDLGNHVLRSFWVEWYLWWQQHVNNHSHRPTVSLFRIVAFQDLWCHGVAVDRDNNKTWVSSCQLPSVYPNLMFILHATRPSFTHIVPTPDSWTLEFFPACSLLATPKSVTLMPALWPLFSNTMFSNFKSQWITPLSCFRNRAIRRRQAKMLVADTKACNNNYIARQICCRLLPCVLPQKLVGTIFVPRLAPSRVISSINRLHWYTLAPNEHHRRCKKPHRV